MVTLQMSFSSELREWIKAAKELWREEHEKHPYLHWFVALMFFIYFMIKYLRTLYP